MIKDKTYIYDCTIEFEDVDSYEIAHHSKLINLLERARVHFFDDQNLSVTDGKLNLVMVSMEVKFLKPAKLLSKLQVHLSVDKISSASLVWDYKILENDNILLESKVKQASVDINTMRPSRFADEYLAALKNITKD
jgi:YbgC/YbaW family acyl-CoA thioester hydrolase